MQFTFNAQFKTLQPLDSLHKIAFVLDQFLLSWRSHLAFHRTANPPLIGHAVNVFKARSEVPDQVSD